MSCKPRVKAANGPFQGNGGNNQPPPENGNFDASQYKGGPKDNSITERFMSIFKEHKINNKTFQQELFCQIENNLKFKGYNRYKFL